jgi:glycine cleavage system H protein
MKANDGLKFTKEHEWAKAEGGKVYVGISAYAQNALGDIVYVELPEIGLNVKAGDTISVVESVKTASDVYSPVSGTVIEVNEALEDAPELLNEDPYENYIAVIDPDDLSELDDLMGAEEYDEYCSEEE